MERFRHHQDGLKMEPGAAFSRPPIGIRPRKCRWATTGCAAGRRREIASRLLDDAGRLLPGACRPRGRTGPARAARVDIRRGPRPDVHHAHAFPDLVHGTDGPSPKIAGSGGSALPRGRAWHAYKRRSPGPSLDRSFVQSNFGIVTRMRVRLTRLPEAYAPATLSIAADTDFEPAVDTIRELRPTGGRRPPTQARRTPTATTPTAASWKNSRRRWPRRKPWHRGGWNPADLVRSYGGSISAPLSGSRTPKANSPKKFRHQILPPHHLTTPPARRPQTEDRRPIAEHGRNITTDNYDAAPYTASMRHQSAIRTRANSAGEHHGEADAGSVFGGVGSLGKAAHSSASLDP
jgi:hypothetical protein